MFPKDWLRLYENQKPFESQDKNKMKFHTSSTKHLYMEQ